MGRRGLINGLVRRSGGLIWWGARLCLLQRLYLRHLDIRWGHLYVWGLRCYCGNCWWRLGRLANGKGKDISWVIYDSPRRNGRWCSDGLISHISTGWEDGFIKCNIL